MDYFLGSLAVFLLAVSGFWWISDDFDAESIRGSRIVITGASSEMGKEIAYQYCSLGTRLLLTARQEDRLWEVADHCKALGAAQVEVVVADLFYRKGRTKVIKETEKRLGGLDHLILNHGSFRALGWWMGNGENMTALVEDFHLNFIGYVDLVSKALPMLATSSGHLGIVTSLAGKFGAPGLTSLTADRFAIEGFFSTLRQELKYKHLGISVTMCYLGFVGTSANLELQSRSQREARLTSAALPADAARTVMQAVSGRAYHVYYPFSEWLALILQKLFPDMVENQFQRFILE